MPAGSKSRRPSRAWFTLIQSLMAERGWRDRDLWNAIESAGVPIDPSWVYRIRTSAVPSAPVLWALSQAFSVDMLDAYVRSLNGTKLRDSGTALAKAALPTLEDEQGGEVLKIALSRIDPDRTGEFLAEVGHLITKFSLNRPRERRSKTRHRA